MSAGAGRELAGTEAIIAVLRSQAEQAQAKALTVLDQGKAESMRRDSRRWFDMAARLEAGKVESVPAWPDSEAHRE